VISGTTGGQVADCEAGKQLLERLPTARVLHGFNGYDTDALRRRVEANGTLPNKGQPAERKASARKIRSSAAFGGPGDPVGAVAEDHEGEKLAAVVHAVPADRAVTIGGDDDPTVAGDVHRPGFVGRSSLPEL
jgi:hypothetical protein